ncbi:D-amino-acid N-acetyltransferase [Fusarium oxysporum]|nr:hypothetical protein FOWG_01725 [Fusarium oxysporum f. sp. lycopersici MN25]KAJ4109496.1 D-amino-acid N-acetyltransferase [Fusarium oxysporum]
MSSALYSIEKPVRSDYEEWSKLFRAYIDFYKSKIDEDQYARTFDRIIEEKNGLQALVVRQVRGEEKKLVGIAHFFPEQTPWSEKQILLLNDVGREKGFMRVQWVTKHDNTAARKLYDTLAESQFVQYRMAL